MSKEHNLSLRERKYAQTKIALVNAAVNLMKEKRFKDIALKELCDTIPISEMTFYHYFPKKTDLLVYVIQLWGLELAWKRKQWEQEKSGLEIIATIFETTAQKTEENPIFFAEAVRMFSQRLEKPCFEDLSIAEKLSAFPDFPGIENIQVTPMEIPDMLKAYLEQAVREGELPESADLDMLALMLEALQHGSLMKAYWQRKVSWRVIYKQQLQLIWDGVWAQDAKHQSAEKTASN